MKKKKIIEVGDKKELWEQMKKESGKEVMSVRFESIETNEKDSNFACFVEAHCPKVTSNFQESALISGLLSFVNDYINSIETPEDFMKRFVVMNAITDGMKEITMSSLKIAKFMGDKKILELLEKMAEEEGE